MNSASGPPFDVIMDPLLPSYDKHSWLILRKWENKYDLAAKYPKWADRIVQLSAGIDIGIPA
jgi:hypothetical protein